MKEMVNQAIKKSAQKFKIAAGVMIVGIIALVIIILILVTQKKSSEEIFRKRTMDRSS